MRRLLVPILLTVLVPRAEARAQTDPPDVAAAIGASAAAFSRALERGDGEGMAAQYTDDATLVPPNGRVVTGKEAIRAFWTPRNPDFRTLDHSLTTERLEVTGDAAIEVGTWRQRARLGDDPPRETEGRYLVVWRRQPEGTWKMQFDAWTRPVEPAD